MSQLPVPSPPPGTAAEILILEDDNPKSVVNLVPPTVKQAFKDFAWERPELFNRDEKELYKLLRDDNKQPTPTDNRIRIRFWEQYDNVHSGQASQISITAVLAGLCSREFFYNQYLKRIEKAAWLLCPPTGYRIKTEEALEYGIEQLRDILDQPHVLGGKVDHKLGKLKLDIVALLDSRVKGAVVQRTMNLHLTKRQQEGVTIAKTEMTAEQLMKELTELDRKNRRAQNLPLAPQGGDDGGKPDIEIS